MDIWHVEIYNCAPQEDFRLLYNSMLQLCEPQPDEEKSSDGHYNRLDNPPSGNTFANVRRINTLPRSPEHIVRTDTLWAFTVVTRQPAVTRSHYITEGLAPGPPSGMLLFWLAIFFLPMNI